MTEAVIKSPEETLACFLPQITFKDVDLDPKFRTLPVRVQAILIMRSMGFTPNEIGKLLDMGHDSVSAELYRYDPDHHFRLSPAQIREIQKSYWTRIQNMAFAGLTVDQMENVPPEKRIRMASAAQKALDGIEAPKTVQVSAAALLKRLCESKAVSVEAEEVKKNAG